MLVLRASFSAFQVFFCRRYLQHNALTGTIPSEISTLTKLTKLYAPSLIKIIECWSYFYSVLVMCAFSQLFKASLFTWALSGTFSPQVSTLICLYLLYASSWNQIIEFWSYTYGTKPMALFQVNGLQPLHRHSARTPIGPRSFLHKIVATTRWLPKQSVPTRSRWRQEFWLLQAKASAPQIIQTPTEVPQHLIITFPQRLNISFG